MTRCPPGCECNTPAEYLPPCSCGCGAGERHVTVPQHGNLAVFLRNHLQVDHKVRLEGAFSAAYFVKLHEEQHDHAALTPPAARS